MATRRPNRVCSGSRPRTAPRGPTAPSRSSRRPSMSQRDLVAELHGARIPAPAHVREHVRQIVAGAPAPPRRFTWRRALVVAVPAFAAVAAAVLITRPGSEPTAIPTAPVELQAQPAQHGAA